MRRFTALLALMLLGGRLFAADAPAPTEDQKIEGLLTHIAAQKDLKFVRNGSSYDSATAVKFLRGKWDRQKADIKTAQDFIDKVASKSSTSGQPYLIRLPDGKEIPCRDYLLARLSPPPAQPSPTSDVPPKGFFVDPSFPDGDAVMLVLRRHLSSQFISLTRSQITADKTHDYVRFFAGWGIDSGFESVYYRYLIFVKKKSQPWSEARVFDSGSLPLGPFEGPIELLEQKGREFEERPTQAPEPKPTQTTTR